MELEGWVLTADADQIRRLIRIIGLNSPRIGYTWLGEWLAGGQQTLPAPDGDAEEAATPETVLNLIENIAGIRKISR